LINLLAVTESEVQGVFAGRLVAAASVEEGDLLEIGSGDSNDRADGGSAGRLRRRLSAAVRQASERDWQQFSWSLRGRRIGSLRDETIMLTAGVRPV